MGKGKGEWRGRRMEGDVREREGGYVSQLTEDPFAPDSTINWREFRGKGLCSPSPIQILRGRGGQPHTWSI